MFSRPITTNHLDKTYYKIHDSASAETGEWTPFHSGLRLLFLVPFAPRLDAAHGGGRVIAQLLTHLARWHRVALCYLRTTDEPSVNGALLEQCDRIEEVLIPKGGNSITEQWEHRLRVWGQLLAGKPLWAIGRSTVEYGERVRALVESWHPDIVQIEYHIMGQYLSALKGYPIPRILVEHEPGKDVAQALWRSCRDKGLVMACLNWLAWQQFERTVIHQVQAVVVFTERDRLALSKLGQDIPLVRISPGADFPEHPLNPLGRQPLNLLFVGNFLHWPNVDAALRLTDAIFPQVQARFPESLLYIVGSHPTAEIQQRANEKVIVTGYVPDITPYLDQASLVVAPLRLGGGMRVKILEALASGKAIVASSLAAEGLELANGKQIVLADSDGQFSEAIIDLLGDPQQCISLGVEARAWACANLRWENTASAYDALYHNLLMAWNESLTLSVQASGK